MKHGLQILDESIPCSRKASGAVQISAIVIYNDLHAARRAAEALKLQAMQRVGRKFFGKMRLQLMPVPIAQLQDPACFDHLLSCAFSVDMIVVSLNGPGDFPVSLKKWMEHCLTQKRESDPVVVMLLSCNERVDSRDFPHNQFLRNATRIGRADGLTPELDMEGDGYITEQLEAVG